MCALSVLALVSVAFGIYRSFEAMGGGVGGGWQGGYAGYRLRQHWVGLGGLPGNHMV